MLESKVKAEETLVGRFVSIFIIDTHHWKLNKGIKNKFKGSFLIRDDF